MHLPKIVFSAISLGMVSYIPLSAATTTLIGTYNVNYLYNAAGCYSNGDFSSSQGNPYSCPSGFAPGPIFINAAPGSYEVVDTTVSHAAVWSGDSTGGTRYEPHGGTVDFTLTHGQIVLYYWDWYVADNSPTDFTVLKLYSVSSAPEPSSLVLAGGGLSGLALVARGLRRIRSRRSNTVADERGLETIKT